MARHGRPRYTCQAAIAFGYRRRSGPTIAVRISEISGIIPEFKLGPWPDTDESWDEVEKKFQDLDLEEAAGYLFNTVSGMIEEASR